MTDYRIVCRHVRYWRGAVHRWSTVYPFTGSVAAGNLALVGGQIAQFEKDVCYEGGGNVNGGLYEVAIYDHASGGVPVYVTTIFPWETPGSWVPYTSAYWDPIVAQPVQDAEVALQVEWPAGLGSTGKPVIFRKWYHAVPVPATTEPAPQVPSAVIAAIQAGWTAKQAAISGYGLLLGNSSRLAAATPRVLTFYGNHQMPRGRRKRVSQLNQSQASAVLQIIEQKAYGDANA